MKSLLPKIQTALVLLLIFFIPIFFLPTTQELYITNKFYLLAFGSLLLILIGLIKFLFNGQISLVKTSFDRIIIVLLLAGAASLFFSSPNKIQALFMLPFGFGLIALLSLFYFIMVNQLTSKKHAVLLIHGIIASGLIVGIVAVLSFLNPLKNISLPENLQFLKSPQFSPAGHQLDTLYILGFSGLWLLVSFISKIRITAKKASSIVLIPLIAIFLAAITIIIYRLFKPSGPNDIIQLAPYNVSWYAAIETLKNIKTALFGIGIDNYESIFTQVKPPAYNLTSLWQVNFNLSRSFLLHIWTETGLFGLGSILLLAIYIVREIQRLFQKKDAYRYELIANGVFLALMMILFPPSFMVAFLLFAFCAFIALRNINHQEDVLTMKLNNIPLIHIGIFATSLVFVIGLLYGLFQGYTGEYYFKKSIDRLTKGDSGGAYNEASKAVNANRFSQGYHVQLSQLDLMLANGILSKKKLNNQDRQNAVNLIQSAIAEAKTAVDLNPQKTSTWNNLGLIYRNVINLAQGADSWSVNAYQQALLHDPNNPILKLNLGGIYYLVKEYKTAIQLFEQTVELKRDWANAYYNLAWALYQDEQYDQAIRALESARPLVTKNSPDDSLVQNDLKVFKATLDEQSKKESTSSAKTSPDQELALPLTPAPQVSPPLQFPENKQPIPSPQSPVPTTTK